MKFHQGLALGDSILISGAVIHVTKRMGRILVPCSPEWKKSVEAIYALNSLVEVYTYLEKPKDGLRLLGAPGGLLKSLRADPVYWYEQLGVPFKERWDSCPIAELCREIPEAFAFEANAVFVHDDAFRGFNIPVKGYRPPLYSSIFYHVPMLKAAREIHCMRSAFFHLVESMDPLKADLFCHRSVKACYADLPVKYDWKII